jgi:threonine aldolase
MNSIDLRSDTITRPTPAMRKAMAEAEVGDDVFKEDPTVNRLEALAARRMGKPAALLVASGTMGNLVAQLAHCGRGDETILGEQSHVFFYEQGDASPWGDPSPDPSQRAGRHDPPGEDRGGHPTRRCAFPGITLGDP